MGVRFRSPRDVLAALNNAARKLGTGCNYAAQLPGLHAQFAAALSSGLVHWEVVKATLAGD